MANLLVQPEAFGSYEGGWRHSEAVALALGRRVCREGGPSEVGVSLRRGATCGGDFRVTR